MKSGYLFDKQKGIVYKYNNKSHNWSNVNNQILHKPNNKSRIVKNYPNHSNSANRKPVNANKVYYANKRSNSVINYKTKPLNTTRNYIVEQFNK